MPVVSVLMPVYNAEKYLKEAIDSIISQSFTDWELTIINDGSTDASEPIIRQYKDSRIHYLKNDSNIGLIKTLNKGIDYCSGKYIARMDADDIALPDRLKLQAHFLDKHPDYVMCGTNASIINNEGDCIGKIINFGEDSLLKVHLLFSVPFVHPSVMIRRDILIANRYDEKYKHAEDYELWCRIAKMGLVANIDQELLLYRWHSTNVSIVYDRQQEVLKDHIIERQLKALDIKASRKDLFSHKITFQLYTLGNKQSLTIQNTKGVVFWFGKLLKQNEKKKVYNQDDLTAFLWSRWFVMCFFQKKYTKALYPPFTSYRLAVVIRLVKILLYLKRK